jgi:phenylpropionate dioxygenase-like ring-hydroxylating dioxygenase large terminal subunit
MNTISPSGGSLAEPPASTAPGTSFLRNAWYVAAWGAEVRGGELFHRRILDEPILLYRKIDGTPVALSDRCPHRFAPLHLGKLRGEAVECGYHGLRFDDTGACVHNPHGGGALPSAAHVRVYPVVERYSALWVWMGEAERANPENIPVFDFLVPEHWFVGTGQMLVAANYQLEIDNILDLSHIEFMHPMFATEAVRRGKIQSVQEGDTVWSKRFISGDELNPFLLQAFQIPAGQLADRWLDVRWNAPALMALYTGGVVSGRPRSDGVEVPSAHIFTPETQRSTHYFYAMSFPRVMGPAGETLAKEQVEVLRGPFEREDKPMIEAVERSMNGAELWSLQPVLLAGDAAAVKARRVLEKLIKADRPALG